MELTDRQWLEIVLLAIAAVLVAAGTRTLVIADSFDSSSRCRGGLSVVCGIVVVLVLLVARSWG